MKQARDWLKAQDEAIRRQAIEDLVATKRKCGSRRSPQSCASSTLSPDLRLSEKEKSDLAPDRPADLKALAAGKARSLPQLSKVFIHLVASPPKASLDAAQMSLSELAHAFHADPSDFGYLKSFRREFAVLCAQSAEPIDHCFALLLLAKPNSLADFNHNDVDKLLKAEVTSSCFTSVLGKGVLADEQLFKTLKNLLVFAQEERVDKEAVRHYFKKLLPCILRVFQENNHRCLRQTLELLCRSFTPPEATLSDLPPSTKADLLKAVRALSFSSDLALVDQSESWELPQPNYDSPEATSSNPAAVSRKTRIEDETAPKKHSKPALSPDSNSSASDETDIKHKPLPHKLHPEEDTLCRPAAEDKHSEPAPWFLKMTRLLEYILRQACYKSDRDAKVKALSSLVELLADELSPSDLLVDCLIYENLLGLCDKLLACRVLEKHLSKVKPLIKIAYFAYSSTSLSRTSLLFHKNLPVSVKQAAVSHGLLELVLSLLNNYNIDYKADLYSLFVRVYQDCFDLGDLETLEKISAQGSSLISGTTKAVYTSKTAQFFFDHYHLNRYLAKRKLLFLPATQHLLISSDRILRLRVPKNYGRFSELIFNSSLSRVIEVKLGIQNDFWRGQDYNSNSTETHNCLYEVRPIAGSELEVLSSFKTRTSKYFCDILHKGCFFVNQDMYAVFLRASVIRKVCTRTGFQQPVFNLSFQNQKIVCVQNLKYCKADTLVVQMNRRAFPIFPLIGRMIKLKTRKQLLNWQISKEANVGEKYFHTRFGPLQITTTENHLILICFLFMRFEQELALPLSQADQPKEIEARGRHLIILTLSSVDIYSLDGFQAAKMVRINTIQSSPFRKMIFLTPLKVVLCSKYWPNDVLTLLDLESLAVTHVHLNALERGLKEDSQPFVIDKSQVQDSNHLQVFFKVSRNGKKLLYGRKINRCILPFDSIDPYSCLQLLNISDILHAN